MKKRWKKVTPVPPEFGGHGYLWDCPICGKVKISCNERPLTPCERCGFYEVNDGKKE